tara:strand:+ start:13829 stop:14860 length:1032 start_codon:yes stop_codon:yes gene_type:complete
LKVLGIETSCDETAVSVVEDGTNLLSNVIASQAEMHAKFGGIVPEVASRQHLLTIIPTIEEALNQSKCDLSDLDLIAVTNGPGLAGALLVGVNSAKGLAMAGGNIPLIGINHLSGHIYASWLDEEPETMSEFPFLCLVASGGHTDLILMKQHSEFELIARTRDDAAGEAFDKAARILGLKFPGGPEIEKISKLNNKSYPKLPRPLIKGSLDFSFSGLKSSLIRYAEEKKWYPKNNNTIDPEDISEVASAFQEAVVDTLIRNTLKAIEQYNVNALILGGGVTANSLLREKAKLKSPVPVIIPSPKLCTDNGAMIATAGYFEYESLGTNQLHQWDMDAIPNLKLG